MKYFDVLLGRYLGGCGSSSGGDCDFSTATVTLINNSTNNFILYGTIIFEGVMYNSIDSADIDGSEVEFVLYKGSGFVHLSSANVDMSATGDVEVSGGDAIITGNGTITFADAVPIY